MIVVSALSDVESKVRYLELGANDDLTEPFALAELMARMRETATPPPERFLRVGVVTLDLQRHVAEVGGAQVPLPLREFQLLAFLMRRAGTGSSCQQLLAAVWDCRSTPARTSSTGACGGYATSSDTTSPRRSPRHRLRVPALSAVSRRRAPAR